MLMFVGLASCIANGLPPLSSIVASNMEKGSIVYLDTTLHSP